MYIMDYVPRLKTSPQGIESIKLLPHGGGVDSIYYSRFFLEDGADDLLGERVLHHVRLGQVCRFPVVQAIDAPVEVRTSFLCEKRLVSSLFYTGIYTWLVN